MLNKTSILYLFFVVLVFIGFAPTCGAHDIDEPPIELPFFPKKIGESYSFDVNLVEQLNYSVDVRFYLILPNKWLPFIERKPDPKEAQNFHKILGGGEFVNHEWIEHGVPAKFRVQVIRTQDNKIILDELVSNPKTLAFSYGRYAQLIRKSLAVGFYTIRLEYLEGAPELAPLHASILFGRANHGK